MTKKKPNKPVPGDDEDYIIKAITARAQAKSLGFDDVVDTIDYMMELAGIEFEDKQDGSTKWTRTADPVSSLAISNNEMPSAARDAALEEAAARARTFMWEEFRDADDIGDAIIALKSIAAPVADAAEKVDDLSDWPSLDYCAPLIRAELGWVPGEPNISTTTPAPVQQAAPSGPCAIQGAEKLPLCVGTCAKQGQCIEQEVPSIPLSDIVLLAKLRACVDAPMSADYAEVSKNTLLAAISAVRAKMQNDRATPAQPVGLSEQDKLDAVEVVCKAWDGCVYDAAGENLDIGNCLRKQLSAILGAALAGLSDTERLEWLIENDVTVYSAAAGYRVTGRPENGFHESAREAIDAAILATKEAP